MIQKHRGFYKFLMARPKRSLAHSDISIQLSGLKEPQIPDLGACCMGGCVNCVWDIYIEEAKHYQAITGKKINHPLL